MNWGKRIALTFVAFVVFIGYLVYRTTQVNIDLVAEDYYQQELNFQEQLDKQQRLSALGQEVELVQEVSTIRLRLPEALVGKTHQGTVRFLRPQSKTLDRTFPIAPDAAGSQQIATAELITGQYLVKVDWTSDGTSYYFEQPLYVR